MPNKYSYFRCELCQANHIRANNIGRHCLFHKHKGNECPTKHYSKEQLMTSYENAEEIKTMLEGAPKSEIIYPWLQQPSPVQQIPPGKLPLGKRKIQDRETQAQKFTTQLGEVLQNNVDFDKKVGQVRSSLSQLNITTKKNESLEIMQEEEANDINWKWEFQKQVLDQFNEEEKDGSAAGVVQTKLLFEAKKETADAAIQFEEQIDSLPNKFENTMLLIQNNINDLRSAAQREKILLRMPASYDENEQEYIISDVSDVPHPSQVNSQEARDTFFDMLSVSNIDTETLVDAQTLQLKQSVAEVKALKDKMLEYQFQLGKKVVSLQQDSSTKDKLIQEYKNLNNRGGTKVAVKRKDQTSFIRQIFKEHQSKLVTTESWLEQISIQFKKGDLFKKCGNPICDIIIMNRFPLIFGYLKGGIHDQAMKAFFLSYGVPVAYIRDTAKNDGKASIKLDDAFNEFDELLILNLEIALKKLRERIKEAAINKKLSQNIIKQELERVYIAQIDYTQDLIGFFVSSDITNDLKDLCEAIPLIFKSSKQHKQLMTCLQLIKYMPKEVGERKYARIKVYNKSVHLLTCGQFKKWLNMRIKDLLHPSQSFYQSKIQPSQLDGLSRIEVSMYFESQFDWEKEVAKNFKDAKLCCEETFQALNRMSRRFFHSISLREMIKSYFLNSLQSYTFVAFEDDLWAICYYFNKKSYTYTGYEVNKTSKSGSRLAFLKRYLYPGQKCLIFTKGKLIGECQKLTGKIQVPISSLNEKHREEYEFGLDPVFTYHLKQDELDQIKIISSVPGVQALLDIPALYEEKQVNSQEVDIDKDSYDNQPRLIEQHPQYLKDQALIGKKRKRQGAGIFVLEREQVE